MSVNRVISLLSMLAMGAIVLYGFFTSLSHVSPGEVARVSTVVAALAVLLLIRSARIGLELRDPGGDPTLRDERNRARERRGF